MHPPQCSTAIFVPFTTQELFDNGKESLYYGLNALSNNLIMVDRKKLKNPNGLILGTPGSGKSFSAKREICNAFLVTDDDIIICDPECEYAPLVERLHGQVIHISPALAKHTKGDLHSIEQISERMLSTPTESSVEFMVAELDDALQSLMFRWNICYERYSAFRLSDNEKKKIGSIIQSGIDFLQKKKEVPL